MTHMLRGEVSTAVFDHLAHELLAETDFAVIGFNERLEVVFANRGLLALVESTAEEVLGQPGLNYFLHTSANDLSRAVQAARVHGSWRGPMILRVTSSRAIGVHAHLRRGPKEVPLVLFLFS